MTSEKLNGYETNVENSLAYNIALKIIDDNEDLEPRFVEECKHRNNWPKWKDAINAELQSLAMYEVFGLVVHTPDGAKLVGYKWELMQKWNEKNDVVRYKARLVAQGFSQRLGIDYEETYSYVADVVIFRYLINLVVHERLDMHLMDVVTLTYMAHLTVKSIGNFLKDLPCLKHKIYVLENLFNQIT